MDRPQTRSLVLILARELASNVSTPVFIVDPDGTAVFYNEPAGRVLGEPYEVAGPLAPDEWGARWMPEDLDGSAIPLDGLPLWTALEERRPAHRELRITAADGVKRAVAVTALPLFAKADEFVGALCIFWDRDGTPR